MQTCKIKTWVLHSKLVFKIFTQNILILCWNWQTSSKGFYCPSLVLWRSEPPTSYPQVPKASSPSWFSGQLQGKTAWVGGNLWFRYTENCLQWKELLEIQKRWWTLCLQLDFWSLHSSLYHQTQNFIWNRGQSHPSCWGGRVPTSCNSLVWPKLTYHTFILMVTQLGHTPPEVPAMTFIFSVDCKTLTHNHQV